MKRHKKPVPDELEASLTVEEVSRILNISKPVVYRLMRDDPDFETFRAGGARRMRPGALQAWIRKQEEKEKVA